MYATRASCDNKALDLVGGKVVPVEVQGVCSYTVYAGPQLKHVVQSHLKSLKLDIKTATLASEVYGSLSPTVKACGELGSESDETGKEPLLIYVMDRMRGLGHLDFVLTHGYPQNSESNFAARKNLMTDIAQFMDLSWKSSQDVSLDYRDMLVQRYTSDLQLLLTALPDRFYAVVEGVLDHLNLVFSLPMVLLHRDFGTSNILVEDKTCHLTGVFRLLVKTSTPLRHLLARSIFDKDGNDTMITRTCKLASGTPLAMRLAKCLLNILKGHGNI